MIIGLTGSIASGKSTVARLLKEKGLPLVDADEIARLVVEPGSPVLAQISETFGEGAIQEDGTMNREYIGNLIFNDESQRQKLNSIIHPAVRKEMLTQKEAHLKAGATTVIMDIPLLFESKLQDYVEKILVVSVRPEIQLKRLMERNLLTKEEAASRIASQLPMDVKERGADEVIDNNGTIRETEQQLDRILAKWKAL